MTDTEILTWLVEHGAIDTPVLGYQQIMGNKDVPEVGARLNDLADAYLNRGDGTLPEGGL